MSGKRLVGPGVASVQRHRDSRSRPRRCGCHHRGASAEPPLTIDLVNLGFGIAVWLTYNVSDTFASTMRHGLYINKTRQDTRLACTMCNGLTTVAAVVLL